MVKDNQIKIAPSVLASDFGMLAPESLRAEEAGADWLHLDVMDGHFVPNITFGSDAVKAIRKQTQVPLDVHLMISHPKKYMEAFVKAGADIVTFHIEAEDSFKETLDFAKSLGVKAGPALNPDTSLEKILPFLKDSDIVLIMSVFPGFGGQSFMPEVLQKVEQLKALREENNWSYDIEIDGGINEETAPLAIQAGVDVIVAGTAVFGKEDLRGAIDKLRKG